MVNLFNPNPMEGYDRQAWMRATKVLTIYDLARVEGVLSNVGMSLGDMDPTNPADLTEVLDTANNLGINIDGAV